MTKLKWGIIGCGVIAPWHADSVVASDYADLVAVCDIDVEKGKAFAEKYGTAFFADYKQMLTEAGIDVVSICTPSGLHSEMAVAAAKAGIHVLCEKPMAITVPQINAMIEAVDKAGVKMEVIFQRRTYPTTQRVREAVQAGVLGQMTLGDAYLKYYRSPAYYKSADWRATWALDGGGALMNQGVHGIDVLAWVMGDVEERLSPKPKPKCATSRSRTPAWRWSPSPTARSASSKAPRPPTPANRPRSTSTATRARSSWTTTASRSGPSPRIAASLRRTIPRSA